MQYSKHLILFLFFIPLSLIAQDITGLWKGTLYNDTTQQYYKYEIGISKEKGKYSGFSHTWFILDDKQYYGVKKVKVKIAADGKILVEDDGLIANNYPIAPNKNVRQFNVLLLDASQSIMNLSGSFSTNRTKEYHSLTGTINLQRKNDFWQSALVPHLQELGKDKELSFVKEEAENKEQAERERLLAAQQVAIKNEAATALLSEQTRVDNKTAMLEKQKEKLAKEAEEKAVLQKEKQLQWQAAEEDKALVRKRVADQTAEENKRKLAEAKQAAETKLQSETLELARKEETRRLEKQQKDADDIASKMASANTEAEKKKAALFKHEEAIKKGEATSLAKQEKEAQVLAEKERLALEKLQAKQQAEIKKQLAKQQKEADDAANKNALAKVEAEKKKTALLKLDAEKQEAVKKENAALLAKQEKDAALVAEKEKLELAKLQITQASASKAGEQKIIIPASSTSGSSAAPAQNVNERKTVLQQTVDFSSDSLLLSLYDNGEIDGDTVSVLMNGDLILAKQGLTTNAIKKTIYIPSNIDRVELIMYAESLGSIPPNTGLLVIRDGKSIYEIRFSGDLQKNASIVFNRKKE